MLTCDEIWSAKPTPRVVVACGSVHANGDYDARFMGDGNLSFWPEGKYSPPPMRGLFTIVSEKETSGR